MCLLSEELQPIVEIDETKRPPTPHTASGVDEGGNEVFISTTPIEEFPGTVPLKPLKGVRVQPRHRCRKVKILHLLVL